MRHGRAKAARKTLQYFARTIGLKPPYHLLLDANFIVAMHTHHLVPVEERIEKVLQNYHAQSSSSSRTSSHANTNNTHNRHFPTKFFILESAMDELNQLVESLSRKKHLKLESFRQALKWAEKHCTVLSSSSSSEGDDDGPTKEAEKEKDAAAKAVPAPAEAIWNYISEQQQQQDHQQQHTQKQKHTPYIVASQDEILLDKLRYIGTVPIIRLASGSVLLLEQPSKSSKTTANKEELHKWKHSLKSQEQQLVEVVKQEQRLKKKRQLELEKESGGGGGVDLYQERKRAKKANKAGGANPLSCKKKSTTTTTGGENSNKKTETASSKRRRRGGQKKKAPDTSGD